MEDAKNKPRIFNIFLSLLIVVFIGLIGFNVYKIGQRLDQKENDIIVLQKGIQTNSMAYNTLKNQIDFNQIQISDLWLAGLKEENYQLINEWETEHMDFLECDKAFNDLYIQRTFFTYNGSPGKLLVYDFEKGYLVYENTGKVYCHLKPIDDNYPPKIDCNELCLENEE